MLQHRRGGDGFHVGHKADQDFLVPVTFLQKICGFFPKGSEPPFSADLRQDPGHTFIVGVADLAEGQDRQEPSVILREKIVCVLLVRGEGDGGGFCPQAGGSQAVDSSDIFFGQGISDADLHIVSVSFQFGISTSRG